MREVLVRVVLEDSVVGTDPGRGPLIGMSERRRAERGVDGVVIPVPVPVVVVVVAGDTDEGAYCMISVGCAAGMWIVYGAPVLPPLLYPSLRSSLGCWRLAWNPPESGAVTDKGASSSANGSNLYPCCTRPPLALALALAYAGGTRIDAERRRPCAGPAPAAVEGGAPGLRRTGTAACACAGGGASPRWCV